MKHRRTVVCHGAYFKIEWVNYTEDGGVIPRERRVYWTMLKMACEQV